MSPVRDPGDRSLRRMERDLVHREEPDAASAGTARDPEEADRRSPTDPHPRVDATTTLEEDFERLPKRQRHGGRS